MSAPIHFGSLEAQERMRLAELSGGASGPLAAVQAGKAAGNINFAPDEAESAQLNDQSEELRQRQERLEQTFELNKRARLLALPTSDGDVRAKLRALQHPITLFGEGPGERRERLRQLLISLEQSGIQLPESATTALTSIATNNATVTTATTAGNTVQLDQQQQSELFYTKGVSGLKRFRTNVAHFSLERARKRTQLQHEEATRIRELYRGQYTQTEDQKKDFLKSLRFYANSASQVGDVRPLTGCRLSKSRDLLATVGWSGNCKLWNVANGSLTATLTGHSERTTSVDVHAGSGLGLDVTSANIATASADSTCRLYSLVSSAPVATLAGHTERLSQVRFHPMGTHVATTSFDNTWRLWDLREGGKCVLEQEGHSKPVYAIAFHPDGSLAGTTGLENIARIWDMRSGKSIQVFEGHVKQVLAIDFHPNGYTVATGSDDHTIKIWDLRKKKCVYTIAAHTHLVSSVRFEPQNGTFLATSSFDCTCKIFGGDSWTLQKTLAGHDARVTAIDVASDGSFLASCSFDRTWKLWKYDQFSNPLEETLPPMENMPTDNAPEQNHTVTQKMEEDDAAN